MSQREWGEGKKAVKRLSSTQRDPCQTENSSVINKSVAAVTGKGTSLSACLAIFRVATFILLPSQQSINWSVQLKHSLGFWAFICMAPWTPSWR